MSKNAGETGALHRLAGQWAAQSGRSLDAIVGAILMLVENILGISGGVRPHETQAWRMPQVPTRLSQPIVSKPHASNPQAMGHLGPFVHDRRARTMLRLMAVSPFQTVQFGSGETRYPRDRRAAT